ncbi:MAG: tetratricopeptide repeat protein [Planctomycetes bacterium]|nr:tetratricopeptide repeat protein [Planctomycetota bacterium]
MNQLSKLIMVSAVIASVPLVAGCATPTPDAIKQVSLAEQDYRRQNFQDAEAKLNRFIKQYPNAPESAEAYYLRSLCGARRSNKVMAEADARQCIKLAKDKQLAANAHATIATLCFEANRDSNAIEHFSAALAVLPDKPPADLLRFRYATCLQREGRWSESRTQYIAVCTKFPGSDIASLAKRMQDWPHDSFAIQCGAFREKNPPAHLRVS